MCSIIPPVPLRQIKDENGNVLRKEADIVKRWKVYFENLLNEENERFFRGNGIANHGVVQDISRAEVVASLRRMKNGKASGPDKLPMEAWKALGDEGVTILWKLANKIFHTEIMPNNWTQSILIPIFKEMGDVQSCENYRGIKS